MPADPNLQQLLAVVEKLDSLATEFVFVGGCATGLLLTEPAIVVPRETIDVDVLCEATSYAEYAEIGERLRALGWAEDSSEGAPICRWLNGSLILDVMPPSDAILGFTNRWYPDAIKHAVEVELQNERRIRRVTAPYFVATKIEAFRSRGRADYAYSQDLEDVIAVVDGRPELAAEIADSDLELRNFLGNEIRNLTNNHRFIEALPGYFTPDEIGQARAEIVLQRFRRIAK